MINIVNIRNCERAQAIYKVLTKYDNIPIHIARDDWKQEDHRQIVPHHQINRKYRRKINYAFCYVIVRKEGSQIGILPKKKIQLNSIHQV